MSLRPLLGDRHHERRWAGIAPARPPTPIGTPRTQSLTRAPPFVSRSALTASRRAFSSQWTFVLSASRATLWIPCIDPRPPTRDIATVLIASHRAFSSQCGPSSFLHPGRPGGHPASSGPQRARLQRAALIPSSSKRDSLCDVQSCKATPLVRACWARVCDSRMRAK